jgi:hypothetical protein
LFHPLDVVSGRHDLTDFPVCHGDVGHETFVCRERTADLPFAFKERVHNGSSTKGAWELVTRAR